MTLPPEELRRRIVSARNLRGLSQAEVGKLMEAQGFGKNDIGEIERAEPSARKKARDIEFTDARRRELAKILDVPEWWFTAPSDELFERPTSQLDRVEQQLSGLQAGGRDQLAERVEQLHEMLGALVPLITRQVGKDAAAPLREAARKAPASKPTRTPRRGAGSS